MKKLKQKLFLSIILSILMVSLIPMMIDIKVHAISYGPITIIDSWDFGNDTFLGIGLATLHPSNNIYSSAVGQTFSTSNDGYYKLTNVTLQFGGWIGFPTGPDAKIEIYEISGTYGTDAIPIGNPLGTSKKYPLESLGEQGISTISGLVFEENVFLEPNHQYAFVFKMPTTGLANVTNYVGISTDNSPPSHSGNSFRYRNGEWNLTYASRDVLFRVYGQQVFLDPVYPNWLSGYQYRHKITISGGPGAGTNYQMKFVIHNGTGTNSGNNIYIPTHLGRSDFGDLRFTDDDGLTKLNYWIEDTATVSGFNATFWVKVSDDLSQAQSIYMYHGNSTATSESYGPGTFQLFDHFDDASVNASLWVVGYGGGAYVYGEESSYMFIRADGISAYCFYRSTSTFPVPIAVEFRAKYTSSTFTATSNLGMTDGTTKYTSSMRYQSGDANFSYISDDGTNNLPGLYSIPKDTNYHRSLCLRTGSDDFLYLNGEEHDGAYPTSANRYVGFRIVNSEPDYVRIDWVAVRKATSSGVEPSFTVGNEEWSQVYAQIDNMEGCGNWLFTQEKYYNFNLSIDIGVALDWIQLSFLDGANSNITVYYRNTTGTYGISQGSTLIRIKTPSRTLTDTKITVIWPIFLQTPIIDAINVDLAYSFNTTLGTAYSGNAQTDYFNIYNHGGLNLNTIISGNASRITGGDIFEFEAWNNSDIYTDYIWRALQHIKMLTSLKCIVGYQSFSIKYGVDFCVGDEWIDGWQIYLSAESVTYGSEVRFNWTVAFFYNNTLIKYESLYMYQDGTVSGVGEITGTTFWIDLWFNQINASSTWGARVNAYEYPMKDTANAWLRWLSSNWGPDETLSKESSCFGTLTYPNGTTLHASEIKLVKVWSELYVVPYTTNQHVQIIHLDVMDLTFCNPPLKGISTPVFDETRVPLMPQGGFLGAVTRALSGIGTWISENIMWGGLSLWPQFVAFMDSIAAWLGIPGAFSNLMSWIGDAWNNMILSLGYTTSLFTQIFIVLGATFSKIITVITEATTVFLSYLSHINDVLGGVYTTGFNFWNDFGMSTWITLILIFYPLHLIILWDAAGFDAVMGELTFIMNILAFIGKFLLGFIGLVLDVIGRIIESIPVVE